MKSIAKKRTTLNSAFFGRASCIFAGVGYATFIWLAGRTFPLLSEGAYTFSSLICFIGVALGVVAIANKEKTGHHSYGVFFNMLFLFPMILIYFNSGSFPYFKSSFPFLVYGLH